MSAAPLTRKPRDPEDQIEIVVLPSPVARQLNRVMKEGGQWQYVPAHGFADQELAKFVEQGLLVACDDLACGPKVMITASGVASVRQALGSGL